MEARARSTEPDRKKAHMSEKRDRAEIHTEPSSTSGPSPGANALSLTTRAALRQLKKDSGDILVCLCSFLPSNPTQSAADVRQRARLGEGAS